MDPATLLVHLGGAASTATLLANVSRRELRTSLGRGEVVRLGRGRYALPFADGLAVADSALRHGDVTDVRLQRAAAAFPEARGPLVRRVVAYADRRAANPRNRADFERDCERYTLLTACGWRVLRLTWRQVIHDPTWVTARLTETMAEAARCA